MNIWRTLLWKEAHEHKWKLFALCSIVLTILIAGSIGNKREGFEVALGLIVYGFALMGPIFVAMNIGSGERSDRSIAFVNALPIPAWKSGAARILAGWLVLTLPFIAVAGFCLFRITLNGDSQDRYIIQLADRLGTSTYFAVLAMITAAIGWNTNMYSWNLFATANQKTELRAGLGGLVVTVALCFTASWTLAQHETPGNHPMLEGVNWILMAASGAHWISGTLATHHFETAYVFYAVFMFNVAVISLLLTIAVWKYGQQPIFRFNLSRGASSRQVVSCSKLKQPPASTRSALLWMQYRQSAPIATCGLVIMLLLAGIQHSGDRVSILKDLGPLIGSILALVIGIGAFVQQLEPELHTFWRSRPISPKQWFWLKYVAGALVLVGCYDVPLFLVELAAGTRPAQIMETMITAPLYLIIYSLSEMAFPILLHLFVYSLAVLAACGIRQPLYSAILAASGGLAVVLLPEVFNQIPEVFCFTDMWRYASSGHPGYLIMQNVLNATLLMGLFIVPSTLLASWLIQQDISVPH